MRLLAFHCVFMLNVQRDVDYCLKCVVPCVVELVLRLSFCVGAMATGDD